MITGSKDFKRDRWGRPEVFKPGGEIAYYTRATTMASTIAERFAIEKYQKRQVALGLSMRPDLVALAAAYRKDDSKLNEIVAEAESAAAVAAQANLGTAKHQITGDVILGRIAADEVSPVVKDEVDAILGCELVEFAEILGVEIPVVNHDVECAGTADRIYRLHDGRAVVGDLKTGRWAIEYASQEIAVQLSIYSHGQVYDPATGFTQPWPEGFDPNLGIVVWAPGEITDKKTGEASFQAPLVYEFDLTKGWDAAALAYYVRQYRREEVCTLAIPSVPPF